MKAQPMERPNRQSRKSRAVSFARERAIQFTERLLLGLCLALAHGTRALAIDDIDQLKQLIRSDFRRLSEDLAAVSSYKAARTTEPLGARGVDVGFELTATRLAHREAWNRARSRDAPNTAYVPKLYLTKGLPRDFELGAFYGSASNSDIDLWGMDLGYTISREGAVAPGLAVRVAFTKLNEVEDLDFDTYSLEITVSKDLALATPYAGLGRVWAISTPVGVPELEEEKFALNRYFIGANFSFAHGRITLEGDKTGSAISYNTKFGFRF